MAAAVAVSGLRKSYGSHEAVGTSTSRSPRARCSGLLGPNGAGKTTTIEILGGYRERRGEREVLGEDPARRPGLARAARRRPPVLVLYPNLTVREASTCSAATTRAGATPPRSSRSWV
jgi:ABC-2 type transport system ATP-binding protein